MVNIDNYALNKKNRASPSFCVDAESLGPEGTMIGYKTKKKRTNKKNKLNK